MMDGCFPVALEVESDSDWPVAECDVMDGGWMMVMMMNEWMMPIDGGRMMNG